MRTYVEAKSLADNRVSEIGSYAGGKTRRVLFLPGPDGTVTARIYKTDIVTWYPDGRVLIDTGDYNTLSTFDGMSAALNIPREAIGMRNKAPHFYGSAFTRRAYVGNDGAVPVED